MEKSHEMNNKIFIGVGGLFILLLLLRNVVASSPVLGSILPNIFLLFIGFFDTQNTLLLQKNRRDYLQGRFIVQYSPLVFTVMLSTLLLLILQTNYMGNFSFEAISSIFYVENIYYFFEKNAWDKSLFSPYHNLYFISLVMNMRFICYLFSFLKDQVKEIFIITIFSTLSLIGFIFFSIFLNNEIFITLNPLLSFFIYGMGILLSLYSNLGAGKNKNKNQDVLITTILVFLIVFLGINILHPLPILLITIVSILFSSILILAICQNNGGFNVFFLNPFLQFLGRNSYIIFLLVCPLFYFFSLYMEKWLAILLSMFAIPLSEYIGIFLYDKKFRHNTVILITCLLIGLNFFAYHFITTKPLPTQSNHLNREIGEKKKEDDEVQRNNILTEFQPSSDIQVQVEQVNAQMPNYFLNNQDLGYLHNQKGYLISDGFAYREAEEFQRILPSYQFYDTKSIEFVDRKEEILTLIDSISDKDIPIILQLGFEDSISYNDFALMIKEIDHNHIYLVNLGGKRTWKAQFNDTVQNLASHFDNVHMIDWNKETVNQMNYFEEEGKLIAPSGQKILVQMIGHSLITQNSKSEN